MTNLIQKNTSPSDGEADSIITNAPLDVSANLPDFIDLLPSQLHPYWKLIQQFPLLETSAITVLFLLLALIVSRYVIRIFGFFTKKTSTNIDDQISAVIQKPILKTITLFGLLLGMHSAELNETYTWLNYFIPVVGSYLVILWTSFALKSASIIIHSLAKTRRHKPPRIDVRMEPLLIIVSKIVLVLICSYLLLTIWGINPAGLLASAGIIGIAVGFAAKDTLANLFSGVFILADTPYKLGDHINLDSGERGKVTHIGIRSTRILTRDDIEIIIPNALIGNAKVVNEDGGPTKKMRLRVDVQCAYDADLELVCEVLEKVAEDHQEICGYPSPRVRIRGFADSGIDFQLLCWIGHPVDKGRLLHELYLNVHKGFKQNELEIPYPKRDLYLVNKDS